MVSSDPTVSELSTCVGSVLCAAGLIGISKLRILPLPHVNTDLVVDSAGFDKFFQDNSKEWRYLHYWAEAVDYEITAHLVVDTRVPVQLLKGTGAVVGRVDGQINVNQIQGFFYYFFFQRVLVSSRFAFCPGTSVQALESVAVGQLKARFLEYLNHCGIYSQPSVKVQYTALPLINENSVIVVQGLVDHRYLAEMLNKEILRRLLLKCEFFAFRMLDSTAYCCVRHLQGYAAVTCSDPSPDLASASALVHCLIMLGLASVRDLEGVSKIHGLFAEARLVQRERIRVVTAILDGKFKF